MCFASCGNLLRKQYLAVCYGQENKVIYEKTEDHSLSYDLSSGVEISACVFDFSNFNSSWH